MKKLFSLSVLTIWLALRLQAQELAPADRPWVKNGALQVASQDPHFLSFKNGKPFFWLGDTGWEAIHVLTRQEITSYFRARKQQGFNVIQTVILSEFEGLTRPNAYGSLPLIDKDPDRLDTGRIDPSGAPRKYTYWDHVDFTVDQAERQGLFIALLPCWGEYVVPREGHGLFKTEEQTYAYGYFLGKRYRNKKNIIWILGGDRHPDEAPGGLKLWRAMAKGLADGSNQQGQRSAISDYSGALMTYHCSASSSAWFQSDLWLAFNMWGSYHSNYSITKAFQQVYQDWELLPVKPTLNGEPAYEDALVNWLPNNGIFQAYDVRQIAYWSVLAGACGHTYGNNSVWQFYDPQRGQGTFHPDISWQKALLAEGAGQLKYLRNLIESRPQLGRKPANELINNGGGDGSDQCIATMGKGYALIYLPTGFPVTVSLNKTGAKSIKAWWYNPRNGQALPIGQYDSKATISFAPPGISKELSWLKTGRGCDWVLVLDDADAGFSEPGKAAPGNTLD